MSRLNELRAWIDGLNNDELAAELMDAKFDYTNSMTFENKIYLELIAIAVIARSENLSAAVLAKQWLETNLSVLILGTGEAA